MKFLEKGDNNWSDLIFALLLGIFTVIFFTPSLNMPFFWDDVYLIERNPYLEKIFKVSEVFYKQEFTSGGIQNQGFNQHIYRPLRTLYFIAVIRLFGKSEVHFHLFSLLAHFVVVFLLWRIFKREGSSSAERIFWSVGLCVWFLFHPIHLENINMISGVSDIFGSLIFLFLFQFIQKRTALTWIEVAGIALGVYIAMLFKEMFITLPVILIFVFRQIKFFQGVTLCLVSVLYFFQRLLIIPHVSQIDLSLSLPERLAYTAKAFFYYLYLFFYPQFPSENYLCPKGMPDAGWTGLMIIVFLAIASGSLIKKTREFSLYGSAFIISLVPVLHLIPINTFVNDRLFYFPSVVVILLLSKTGLSLKRFSPLLRITIQMIAGGMLIFSSGIGFLQNLKWDQPERIWKEAWETTDSVRFLWNMVYEMERSEKYQEMLDYFQSRPVIIPEVMHCFYYQELCFASVALHKEEAKEYLKVLLENMNDPVQKDHYKESDLKNFIQRLKSIDNPLSSELIKTIQQNGISKNT